MADRNSPQLWWRPPGQAEIFTLVPDELGTTSFQFVPFNAKGTSDALRWKGHVVTSDGPAGGILDLPKSPAMASTGRKEHLQMVQHALRHIEEGTLDKVVVSRTQWISSRSRPEQAFQKLCQMHPRALVYLMHHPQEGTWCGATPERDDRLPLCWLNRDCEGRKALSLKNDPHGQGSQTLRQC